MPGPRKLRMEVRFALSYEALKMNGKFSERVTPLMISAMRSACSSLSITHGPAIRKRSPEPTRTLSIWKEEVKTCSPPRRREFYCKTFLIELSFRGLTNRIVIPTLSNAEATNLHLLYQTRDLGVSA